MLNFISEILFQKGPEADFFRRLLPELSMNSPSDFFSGFLLDPTPFFLSTEGSIKAINLFFSDPDTTGSVFTIEVTPSENLGAGYCRPDVYIAESASNLSVTN
jgi:hypothetical protein